MGRASSKKRRSRQGREHKVSKAPKWLVPILAWGLLRGLPAHAADQTVSGNLTVTGNSDLQGGLALGVSSGTSNGPGLTLGYVDGYPTSVPDQIQFVTSRPQSSWLWLYTTTGSAVQPQMWLDSTNVLTLYDRQASPAPGIQLNPAGASIFAQSLTVNGTDSRMPNQTLADPSSILTRQLADGRYLANSALGIQVGNASSSAYVPPYYVYHYSDGDIYGTGSAYNGWPAWATASGYYSTLVPGYWKTPTVGPAVALPGGTASGAYSVAGIGAVSAGPYSTAFTQYATASGYYSVAMGRYATAGGDTSVAIGSWSNAGGKGGVAVGVGATASGYYAMAQGLQATASGIFSHADGASAVASGESSSAIGNRSLASGYGSSALAFSSGASGDYAVAVGTQSYAQGENSITIGFEAHSIGVNSTAIGPWATSSGDGSFAEGMYTTASGYGQVVMGRYNLPQGQPQSMAATDDLFQIGNGRADPNTGLPSGSNAFAVKKNGTASVFGNRFNFGLVTGQTPGVDASAAARINYADGAAGATTFSAAKPNSSWAWQNNDAATAKPQMKLDGNNVLTIYDAGGNPAIVLDPSHPSAGTTVLTEGVADGRYLAAAALPLGTAAAGSFAIGGGAAGSGGGYAFGYNSNASDSNATALGSYARASSYGAMAVGYTASASGAGSGAFGQAAHASGNSAAALGNTSSATGDYSVTEGFQAQASGEYANAAGAFATAAGYGQFVVGQYNAAQGNALSWIATDDLFQVGNGTDSAHPSNAFTVKKNGDATVSGNLTAASLTVTHVEPQGDLSMGSFTGGQ